MSEQESIAVSVNRIEKLLIGVTSKIQELIEKHGVHNSPLLREIVDFIELLKKFVVSRMKRTPEVESAYAIDLQDCRKKIAETLAELEALQEISDEQNSSSDIFLRDIVTCVNDEEEIMRSIRETSEVKIPREIEESMREMLIVKEREEMRKKVLQSEIDLAKRKLQDVIEINIAAENELFNICAKIEEEYIALLTKYDCDISACHVLTEKLSKDNEVIKAEIKEMKDQLVMQRQLYTQFKKEQEIAMNKAFAEKLEFFRRNRATKIIQRIWRAYFERISLKKRRKTKRK